MDSPFKNSAAPRGRPAPSPAEDAAAANKGPARSRRRLLWIGSLALVAIVIPSTFLFRSARKEIEQGMSFRLRKMDLVISVLEGGTLISPGSLEIKSKVEGQTTIISVIPEGAQITPADVQNKKVLIELDSSALRERAADQAVTVEGSDASFTQARESYDIQKNLNDNNIQAAELKARFALMDLEKYLGATLTPRMLKGEITPAAFHDISAESEESADSRATPQAENASQTDWRRVQSAILPWVRVIQGEAPVASLRTPKARSKGITFRLETLHVGGTARQDWRKFQTAIELADEDLSRATTTYEWSKRLGPKELGGFGYVTWTDLEADHLALKRCELQLEQSKLDLDIFLRYELPKQIETLLSAYRQACKDLELEHAKARAELAKAEAQLKSAEATYRLQKGRLDKLNQQIEACLIRATRPGMAVYPQPGFYGRGADKIEEGAIVRERQVLLTIPDAGNMAVNVKVHEASVNKVQRGQKARVVLDGFPDREYWGQVQKVAVMADTLNPWLSPDLKVFNVLVALDNPPADLKPGMSAQVEITIAKLADILAVPVQAVATVDGRRICYVAGANGVTPRAVQTGQFNNDFIEITGGLEPGEKVLLHTPVAVNAGAAAPDDEEKGAKPAAPSKPPEATGSTPASTPKDSDALTAFLRQVPADRQAEARKRWETATPAERTELEKSFRQTVRLPSAPPLGATASPR